MLHQTFLFDDTNNLSSMRYLIIGNIFWFVLQNKTLSPVKSWLVQEKIFLRKEKSTLTFIVTIWLIILLISLLICRKEECDSEYRSLIKVTAIPSKAENSISNVRLLKIKWKWLTDGQKYKQISRTFIRPAHVGIFHVHASTPRTHFFLF